LVEGKEVSDEDAKAFGDSMATLVKTRLVRDKREPTLRMSSIGKPARQLWYEINKPETAEPLHPNAYLKFLIGDIYEEMILFLAAQSGHKVEGMQDELDLYGIKGHRDAVIDGITVDVKSASPYSFKKFEEGLSHDKDAFGYLQQINNYMEAGKDDPLVTIKDQGAFLAANKVTGDLHLDVHKKSSAPIEEIIKYKKEVVTLPEPPERCFEPEDMGKSGNKVLGINCSYCAFKRECHPGLRTFLYSTGPKFFTHIEEEPRVPEVKNNEEETEVT
jgi:hypothetical protein